jgi:adenylylsulfate kinase-like enzyme
MNYGEPSVVTDADRRDLKELYRLARSRMLRAINGTEVVLVRPASALGT